MNAHHDAHGSATYLSIYIYIYINYIWAISPLIPGPKPELRPLFGGFPDPKPPFGEDLG